MTIKLVALPVVFAALHVAAQAQDIAEDFPADARPMADDDLKARVGGRSFDIPTAKDGVMQIELKDNGWASFAWPARRYNDTGKWYVKDGRWCIELNKQRGSPAACNETRDVGGQLYFRRATNGEVVSMNPK